MKISRSRPVVSDALRILEQGEIQLKGQFMLGSNYTFLVTVAYNEEVLPAVYKPVRGEQPLWDFPPASLAKREVGAYRVSEALGWGLVPCTVLREGPFGPGSLQEYIEHDPDYHYFNFSTQDRQRLDRVALFDLLINNADRKGSHVMLQQDTRRLYAIDHGLCFHVDDKLRTVIWDFAGSPFPPELVKDLEGWIERLTGPWSDELRPLLSGDEIEAFSLRAQRLLKEPVFPMPPEDRRAFPYPPL